MLLRTIEDLKDKGYGAFQNTSVKQTVCCRQTSTLLILDNTYVFQVVLVNNIVIFCIR